MVVLLVLVVLLIGTALGETPFYYDLRTYSAVFGQGPGNYLGSDLVVGDVSGDGRDDFFVGAPLAKGTRAEYGPAGRVYGCLGGELSWARCLQQGSSITISGPPKSYLGGDMYRNTGHLAIGDIDGDGYGDLVLGMPEFRRETPLSYRGGVMIAWGQPNWPSFIDLANPDPELQVTTFVPGAWTYLGAAVAVGDFDGDGLADIAMSAPKAAQNAGVVYVVFGQANLRDRVVSLTAIPEDPIIFKVVGFAAGDVLDGSRIGSFLALGDLSGDGIDDLVIASANSSTGGRVHLLFGGQQRRGEVVNLSKEKADWESYSPGQYGCSLAVGDFNGDHLNDLLVGNPSTARGAGKAFGFVAPFEAGAVVSAEEAAALVITGPEADQDVNVSWLGESLAVGDFNGDGIGDVVVGAKQADGFGERVSSGEVYLFYGGSDLQGVVHNARRSADVVMAGAYPFDFTGNVAVGQVSGGTEVDLGIGALERDGPFGVESGAAYLVPGFAVSLPKPTAAPSAVPTSTTALTPGPTPSLTAVPSSTPWPTVTPLPMRPTYFLPLLLR